MNVQKYMAFVKTVQYGSFTKAAAALNYSQSGISRMIAELEGEWGLDLLERGKGGVRLTSEGQRLLPYAESLIKSYEDLKNEANELKELKTGIIRIGAFSSVATHRLPKVIKRFRRDYPYIDYEILMGDYTEIERWLREGRVDCGFLRMPLNNNLEVIFLERDELMAVIPKDHPLAGAEKFPVNALCGEPFMLLEKGAKGEISELFEKYSLKPDIKFITWDDYAVMSMVENGLGISILPRLILKRAPYDIVIKSLDVPAYRDICIAFRSKKTASRAVKRFIEYL